MIVEYEKLEFHPLRVRIAAPSELQSFTRILDLAVTAPSLAAIDQEYASALRDCVRELVK